MFWRCNRQRNCCGQGLIVRALILLRLVYLFVNSMRRMVLFTVLALLVSFTDADKPCTRDCRLQNPSNMWYVWYILIFICGLLLCGLIVGCIKMFCRPNKPPVPMFEGHPFEVTVISVDNQTTINSFSTVSSLTDSHPSGHPPHLFSASSPSSPPPYNLYAMESPPLYDEAVAMPADTRFPGAGVSGNTEDHGACHQICVSGGQPPEFTQRPLQQEDLQDTQDNAVMDEEEPPAYQPYNTVAEEELSEIDLDELDPTDSDKEDINTPGENE
ncbi:hypothetical protein AGOR_G00135150 [Albula goreensis]|uniref:Transmembrane protein 52 n=1 Tax=Albula goreensis TaxID=1534307 RepID=A0A8T3D8X3_9TELE|nr:hypothetical protein AGOR_G00135150 [Albula goreensis]